MQRFQKNNVYFYLIALYVALDDWMHFVLQVEKNMYLIQIPIKVIIHMSFYCRVLTGMWQEKKIKR